MIQRFNRTTSLSLCLSQPPYLCLYILVWMCICMCACVRARIQHLDDRIFSSFLHFCVYNWFPEMSALVPPYVLMDPNCTRTQLKVDVCNWLYVSATECTCIRLIVHVHDIDCMQVCLIDFLRIKFSFHRTCYAGWVHRSKIRSGSVPGACGCTEWVLYVLQNVPIGPILRQALLTVLAHVLSECWLHCAVPRISCCSEVSWRLFCF